MFIIIGIACILASFVFLKSNQGDFLKCEAVISNIEVVQFGTDDPEHEVYVDYTVDGVEYKDVMLDSYHIGMDVGDTVNIEYDTANHGHIRSVSSKFAAPILLAIGCGSLVYGIITAINSKKKPQTKADPFAGV